MIFDTLIYNATIVTVDSEFTVIPDGLVAIANGRIVRVEPVPAAKLPPARETINARGAIILPGLVNAHTHLPMTLFRGLADDLPLHTWLNDHIFPAEGRFINPETVRYGTLLGCIEMLLSGTTTCCDGYFLEDHVAGAVLESGMRAVLGQGVIDFPAPGVPDPAQNIAAAIDFIDKWKDKTPRITPSLFCHSLYTCGPETLKKANRAALEKGVLFQIHVAETMAEKKQCRDKYGITPIRHLARLGILTPTSLLAHCVWVDTADIETIAGCNAAVAHNPESNMKLASGIAPVVSFLECGIKTGLGTDGCASNNDLDMFREMGSAARLHKVHSLDPVVMNAQTVLEMATIGGARAIGLDHQIGSLEPGKQADLIVIDLSSPHLTPMYNPVSHLVYAVKGSDVRDVFVAGEPLVRNHNMIKLDAEKIMRKVCSIAETVKGV
ncbi:MAG: amidohydrolase [Deltaproteobacteria bacterium]|nr:amidohydrolase [Deltaproteobacteria bacterium]